MVGAQHRLLLVGGRGSIGEAIRKKFTDQGWRVVTTTRRLAASDKQHGEQVQFDPLASPPDTGGVERHGPYAAVCWSQGANLNDNVYTVDEAAHLELYRANCLFIVASLKFLLNRKLLAPQARFCVISSIWQNLARQNKLSYCMTKAALQGLVLSAAADLAADGYLINAILPGALDTPMTRQNLSAAQINRLTCATLFNRLPRLEDVTNLAYFLCSEGNTGITGQFIAADLGFSHVRIL